VVALRQPSKRTRTVADQLASRVIAGSNPQDLLQTLRVIEAELARRDADRR